jgi:putative heme-binding domain-containing protein
MFQFVLDDHYQRRNPHFAAPLGRVDVPEVAGNAPVFPISQLVARFNDFHTANRFTSACSAMIYRDDLFGPAFSGAMFVSEPVHNLVHHEVVTPQGVTFRSRRPPDEQQSEFLASSDNWFRPTMIQTGPDGALWIADMYRHVIEHPEWIPADWQAKLDLQAGWDKGRLYRVYPVDKAPRAIPRLDKLDTAGLVAAFDSPSGWQRDTVQQLLIERFGPGGTHVQKAREVAECVLRLEKLARECPRPLARLHALCTLGGLDHPSTSLLLHTLADKSPVVRRHAIRLCEEIAEPPEELIAALTALTGDTDPHVRLQLAYTLGEVSDPRAGTALGALLGDSAGDPYLFAAAMSSLHRRNIDGALTAVLGRSEGTTLNTNLIETLLNQAAALGNDRAFQKLLATVAEPKDGRFAVWQLSAVGTLLDTLERKKQSLADLPTSDDKESSNIRLQKLFAFARTLAEDTAADTSDRIASIRLLGRGTDQSEAERKLLARFLTAQTAPELQAAAVATLSRLPNPDVADFLVEGWRGYGPARRQQVLDVLLSRDLWIERLLTAIEAGDISTADLDANRRQRLSAHPSEAIREKGIKLLAGSSSADRQQVVDDYRPALTLTGDRVRGAQLFAKTCAQCHKLQGIGHEVGPDLLSLTDKSPEAMLVALLDPNRAVEAKFISYTAITSAGRSFAGLLAAETGNSITLRGAEAKDETILRAELDELVSTSKSLMPEGLEKDLTPQDVADIIAHIRANIPLPKRKEFSGNTPDLVRANGEGVLKLSARNCEIYGTTLVFEPQYGNLGFWTSFDDHAAWTIDAPAAGKYRVAFVWACDATSAGSSWKLEGTAGSLTGEVPSTGTWDQYQDAAVGEITLSKGEQRLVLRPVEKPQGALLDLKLIRLTPADGSQ